MVTEHAEAHPAFGVVAMRSRFLRRETPPRPASSIPSLPHPSGVRRRGGSAGHTYRFDRQQREARVTA